MANRNFASAGKMYSMHVMPVLVDCNFVVDADDAAGLGQTDLKGPLVQEVYMNTSASPAITGFNPAAGTIVVRLQDNFNKLFSVRASIEAPLSGSDVKIDNSAMTAGIAYTISILGDATAAKWNAIGVPAGITPAVGVSFIALSNGGSANVSSSRVQASAQTNVAQIQAVQSLQSTLAPDRLLQPSYGAEIILQCLDFAGALVAPTDGTIIHLEMYLSNSSITVAGE